MEIPKVKLGSQGLEVSRLGFGCGALVGFYGAPSSEDAGIAILTHAFNQGVTFFDTADAYGPHTNELLIGKVLKQLPRDKVQVATKFGIEKIDLGGMVVSGKPDYVRACCEASLQRLGVDYIDLYYQHRVDKTVPIEYTIGEMKKLVDEGKVKYIGLSEASPDTIRRAHAVHPITAVQLEWSLFTRDIEEEIVPLCRELGIGIVPYCPLGRGFFGGKAVVESLPTSSVLVMASHPWFTGENLEKNKTIYARIENLASKHHCTPAQLALAWLIHQGDDVVPIPECLSVVMTVMIFLDWFSIWMISYRRVARYQQWHCPLPKDLKLPKDPPVDPKHHKVKMKVMASKTKPTPLPEWLGELIYTFTDPSHSPIVQNLTTLGKSLAKAIKDVEGCSSQMEQAEKEKDEAIIAHQEAQQEIKDLTSKLRGLEERYTNSKKRSS